MAALAERKTMTMRRTATVAGIGLALSAPLASANAERPRQAPLTVVDRSTQADWIESQAWGGGARFIFFVDGKPPLPSGLSLGGGDPEFTFGCSSPNPAGSVWRFRVSFSAAGSGITGADEQARNRADAHYFGMPGTVVLINEMDEEMGRFPLRVDPTGGGLETGALSPADVKRFLNASAIRAETPRLRFEAGTAMLQGVIGGIARPPCGAVG